jgi:arsenate reductase-like glutaredoxin family protein
LRDELRLELDERDYARTPLTVAELKEIFKGRDPREFLNPKSPAFKERGLAGKKLTAEQALKLIVEDSRLLKRPMVVAGDNIIAGFDRDVMRKALS